MRDAHAVAVGAQVVRCRLGDRDAAVLAARAADGDSELLLALGDVARHDAVEQRLPADHEILGLLAVHDEVAHGGVEARQRTQLGIVVGVRQEAHVDHQVGVDRGAVLEAERVDRDGQSGAFLARSEQRADRRLELWREHRGGVDDVMGALAQREQQVALALDALGDGGAVGAERMAAPARLVAGDELLVGGEVHHDAHFDLR